MAGKNSLLIMILTIVLFNRAFGQGIEEQRKYRFSHEESTALLFDTTTSYGGVRLIHHSEDSYFDIYLDSPELLLKKKGYSLRFRRRHLDDTLITYSFQLKSEMTDLNGIRMEVEEQELDFYRVLIDSSWVSLPTLLDPLFNYSLDGKLTDEVASSLKAVSDWIQFKSGAPILPFQQLKAIDPKTFNDHTIGSFRPVLSGRSVRNRFHGIYEPVSISQNRLPEKNKPAMIQENPGLNWVLEASFDKSIFRSLMDPAKSVELSEFEVENKYYIPETGRWIMDQLEKDLLEKLQIIPSKESKYIRSSAIILTH